MTVMEEGGDNIGNPAGWGNRARQSDANQPPQNNNDGMENAQGSQQQPDMYLSLMDTLTGIVQQQKNQQVQQQQQINMVQTRQVTGITEFKKLSPPSFEGTTDPLVAEKWQVEMKKAFATAKCPNNDNVAYGVYMLQGDAYDWWKGEEHKYEEDLNALIPGCSHLG